MSASKADIGKSINTHCGGPARPIALLASPFVSNAKAEQLDVTAVGFGSG
jgi:hypothetical protein